MNKLILSIIVLIATSSTIAQEIDVKDTRKYWVQTADSIVSQAGYSMNLGNAIEKLFNFQKAHPDVPAYIVTDGTIRVEGLKDFLEQGIQQGSYGLGVSLDGVIPEVDYAQMPAIVSDIDDFPLAEVTVGEIANVEGIGEYEWFFVEVVPMRQKFQGTIVADTLALFNPHFPSDPAPLEPIPHLAGKYELYKADTDEIFTTLEGEIEYFPLALSEFSGGFNMRAIPPLGDENALVESIKTTWTGVESGDIVESIPPYGAMLSHSGTIIGVDVDFYPYTLQAGEYEFTVTYYDQDSAQGNILHEDKFILNFVN